MWFRLGSPSKVGGWRDEVQESRIYSARQFVFGSRHHRHILAGVANNAAADFEQLFRGPLVATVSQLPAVVEIGGACLARLAGASGRAATSQMACHGFGGHRTGDRRLCVAAAVLWPSLGFSAGIHRTVRDLAIAHNFVVPSRR